MKILLIGKGHLGKFLKSNLNVSDEYFWTDRMAQLDEAALARIAPDVIVNTAGKTDLAFCESNKDECWDSNVAEPLKLYRRILKTIKCPYIHISSGCVWDGPYREDGKPFDTYDPPTPACFYAWSKAAFDAMLKQEANTPIAILRPRQVYSEAMAEPGQPVRNTLQKLMQYETLIDTPNSMTSSYTILKTIQCLIKIESRNWCLQRTMNVYDRGIITPFTVGHMLAAAGLREKPKLGSKSDLDQWHKPRRVDAVIYDGIFESIVQPPKIEEEMRRVISMIPRRTMTKTDLKPSCVYLTKQGEEIVFKHFGQTGEPVFQPVGEPSFQDCFILKNLESNLVKYVRVATADDLGG